MPPKREACGCRSDPPHVSSQLGKWGVCSDMSQSCTDFPKNTACFDYPGLHTEWFSEAPHTLLLHGPSPTWKQRQHSELSSLKTIWFIATLQEYVKNPMLLPCDTTQHIPEGGFCVFTLPEHHDFQWTGNTWCSSGLITTCLTSGRAATCEANQHSADRQSEHYTEMPFLSCLQN